VDSRQLCDELAALGQEMERARQAADWHLFWQRETLLDERMKHIHPAHTIPAADRKLLQATLSEILRITTSTTDRLATRRDDIRILIDALGSDKT
jgi:hypothetical protein